MRDVHAGKCELKIQTVSGSVSDAGAGTVRRKGPRIPVHFLALHIDRCRAAYFGPATTYRLSQSCVTQGRHGNDGARIAAC